MQLLQRKVCLLRKHEIKSSQACVCPAPRRLYLASSAEGWELTNSLHGLILQARSPASEAYSWKRYACIPGCERLGRDLLVGTQGHGWHRPSRQPGTVRRAPAAGQQATQLSREHGIPRALKDTLWPCPRPHLEGFFSDNADSKTCSCKRGDSGSSQQAAEAHPGVLLEAACLSAHPCVIRACPELYFPSENSSAARPTVPSSSLQVLEAVCEMHKAGSCLLPPQ